MTPETKNKLAISAIIIGTGVGICGLSQENKKATIFGASLFGLGLLGGVINHNGGSSVMSADGTTASLNDTQPYDQARMYALVSADPSTLSDIDKQRRIILLT
jgi:hypothetical protein